MRNRSGRELYNHGCHVSTLVQRESFEEDQVYALVPGHVGYHFGFSNLVERYVGVEDPFS